MGVSTAPPQARTIMVGPSPASTAPGMGIGPGDTLETPTQTASPALRSTGSIQTQPATQALPPQSYPVMATAAQRAAPVVLDVTPRGLGIGTVAGYCEELIRRNARVPTEIRKLFTTSRDNQDSVHIVVCQGESRRLDDNTVIGDLTLDGLPPRERGTTSIEVTFMLDASGILQVRARDAQTGREQRSTLDLVGAVPDADVASSRDRVQALRR
jgi:molecular chaperone DnaK